MTLEYLIHIAPVLALSCIPVSLIIIRFFSDLFAGYRSGISDTTVVCTTELEALTKDTLGVQSLSFGKNRATPHENGKFVLLEDTEKDDEIKIKKSELLKNEEVKYMGATATLCRFQKIQNLEQIILDFFTSCGLGEEKMTEQYEIIEKIPSNEEKRFSSVVAMDNSSKEIFSFAKGQAGILLKQCTRMLYDGKKIEIDAKIRKKLKNRITKLHKNGQKLVAFAYKPLPFKKLDHYNESFVETDMVLLGIVGLGDVLDTDLTAVVADLKSLGIKNYIMSSGKEQKTIAIGHQLGITSPQYFEGIDNEYLAVLNDDQIWKMLSNKDKDYTFFRLTEADKERVIDILQKNGETVTINQIKSGGNLKKILEGIKKERRKKDNYRKLLLHSISCKIMEVILLITAVIFQAPLALTVTLILILDLTINLILESALGLESGPPETSDDIGHLFVTGVFGGILVSSVYIWSLISFGWTPGATLSMTDAAFLKSSGIAFVLLCLLQILNAHNLKNTKKSIFLLNPLKTPYLSLATIASILMIYIFTRYEALRSFFDIGEITAQEWQIVIFISLFIIIMEEIRKQSSKWNSQTTAT